MTSSLKDKATAFLRHNMAGLDPHSIDLMRRSLVAFLEVAADTKPDSLQRFIDCMKTRYAPTTCSLIVGHVAQFLRAHDLLTIQADRILHVDKAEFKGRFLTPDEEALILSCCASEETRAMVIFTLETGLRASQVLLAARGHDVYRSNDLLFVAKHKRQPERYIPLTQRAQEALRSVKAWPWSTVCGIQKAFAAAVRRAGKKGLTGRVRFHDLRHTKASRLAKAGFNPYEIKTWFGWSSVQMTDHYTHADVESIRVKTQSLEALK